MTLTAEPVVATATSGDEAAGDPARRLPGPARSGGPQAVALSVTITLVVLIGFGVFLFGLSGLAEARHQNTLFKTFSYQLGQELAPLGPTASGKPVALLSVPRMGLRNLVVVEGTTSRDLTAGPGHLRQSPLPGQPGTSVIFGRRTTAGGPFAHLLSLQIGDVITATTGQGVSRYRVSSFGTTGQPAPANSRNRLVFETANSTVHPTGAVEVSADLVGQAQPSPGGLPILSPAELSMAGDSSDALVPLLLWSQALLLVAAGGTLAFYRWSQYAAVFCAVPVALAVLWNVYASVAALLPNLY